MTENRVLLICSEHRTIEADIKQSLTPYGFEVTTVSSIAAVTARIERTPPDLILLCLHHATPPLLQAITMLETHIPIVAILPQHQRHVSRDFLRVQVVDYMEYPGAPEDMVAVVHRALKKDAFAQEYRHVLAKLAETNGELTRRVRDFEVLFNITRAIGSLLDWNAVLNRITEAAVYLTGAEEGYLLLVDDASGLLQLRAAQNLGEKHAKNFNININDSIAGTVVRTGKPICLGGNVTKSYKVKTGLLVRSLVDVPLMLHGKVIGVLGVDNQASAKAFTTEHVRQLTQLANVAATTLENARQYTDTRSKLMRRVRELGLLQALTGQLGIITNFETGAQMSLSMLLKATGADAGMLHWKKTALWQPLSIAQGMLGDDVYHGNDYDFTGQQWWAADLLESVLATGKPVIDRRTRTDKTGSYPTSCMTIPLRHGRRVVGAVILETASADAFSADDLFFVSNIADYVTIALEAARLREWAQTNSHRLRTVLDAVDNGVWVFDADLRLVMQNRIAGKLIGTATPDAIGKSIEDLLPSSNGSSHRLVKLVRQALKELRPIAFTNSELPALGHNLPVIAAGRIVPNVRGDEISGVICTLWEARQMQSKSFPETEFARMASHLFRTPVSIIQSSIEVLLDAELSEDERTTLLNTMSEQGQRLIDTTNELLKILRMETEGIAIRAAPVALYPVIKRAMELIRHDNPYITFEVKWVDTIPLVYVDAAKVELILLNLLLNATRRCAKGGHIIVFAHHNADEVVIAVEDTGEPLSQQQKSRVFRRFYPVDDTADRLPSTYNFGLYSIKNLVTLQRGKIWVESEPGTTTKFLFSLPIWEDVHVKNISY